MIEHRPTLLEDLDKTPVGDAPIGHLLSGGQAAKQRRRRATMAGGIAATALVVGGGTIAGQALTGHDDQPADEPLVADGSTDRDRSGDRALGDTHLVGIGKVVITVPEGWKSNAASCNTPVRDTYYFPYPQDCVAAAKPRMSSVAIAAGAFPEAGIRLGGLRPAGQLDGHEVVESIAICQQSLPGLCTQTFGIPDLNAYFRVNVQSDDGGANLVSRIRKSLTLLDADQTVVPFVPNGTPEELVDALHRARLTVVVNSDTCPPTAGCGAGVTSIEPTVGSVAPVGSTVTVTVLEN